MTGDWTEVGSLGGGTVGSYQSIFVSTELFGLPRPRVTRLHRLLASPNGLELEFRVPVWAVTSLV